MDEEEQIIIQDSQSPADEFSSQGADVSVGQAEENSLNQEVISVGNELIDATQNAIVGVAENVTEALTLTEKPHKEHTENIPFYADVEFWVGMSFVFVVLLIARPVCKSIKQGLQNSIEAVKKRIEDAVNLRDDAQKLLAEYEKRCRDIDERVLQISKQTQKNIKQYRERELKNLQKELDKKQKEAQARIEQSMQVAKDEINSSLSKRSVALAKKAIEQNLQDADKVRLIDEAIAELDGLKK